MLLQIEMPNKESQCFKGKVGICKVTLRGEKQISEILHLAGTGWNAEDLKPQSTRTAPRGRTSSGKRHARDCLPGSN